MGRMSKLSEEDQEGDIKRKKEHQLHKQVLVNFQLLQSRQKYCYICVLRNYTVKSSALFTPRIWFTESAVPNDILSFHQETC